MKYGVVKRVAMAIRLIVKQRLSVMSSRHVVDGSFGVVCEFDASSMDCSSQNSDLFLATSR